MGEQLTNRVVYLEKESWWFPVPVSSLKKEQVQTIFNNIAPTVDA